MWESLRSTKLHTRQTVSAFELLAYLARSGHRPQIGGSPFKQPALGMRYALLARGSTIAAVGEERYCAVQTFTSVVFDLFRTLVPAVPDGVYRQNHAEMARALAVPEPAFRQGWRDLSAARAGHLPKHGGNGRECLQHPGRGGQR
jgi:hypothetical protein